MPEITVRNWNNEELRTLELDETVFDYPEKPHLVYEAVCAYQAGGRSGTHQTKNRKDVSGGTRKVWRQKGTGRARVGDNRSPLWRHGGTVHGPVTRSYDWRFPKKMRRNALRSALSDKFRQGRMLCIENFGLESNKTKALEDALRAGLGVETKALLLPLAHERNLELAARNNPRLSVVRALGLNIVDLLDCDTIVISEEALTRLSEVLAR